MKAAKFEDLPPEILFKIFSLLNFRQKSIVSTVCKRWRHYIFDIQKLQIKVGPAISKYNFNTILAPFHTLKRLDLSTSREDKMGAYLLDAVAAQFQGHPSLTHLCSHSDNVVPGAINCPKLYHLDLKTEKWGWNMAEEELIDPSSASEILIDRQAYRDMGFLLSQIPTLSFLSICNPTFSSTNIQDLVCKLEKLHLSQVRAWVLTRLLHWFGNDGAPNLKELELDCDLHLPTPAISLIRKGCPNLTSLKLKQLKLGPDHLFQLACDANELFTQSSDDNDFPSNLLPQILIDPLDIPRWNLETIELNLCHIWILESQRPLYLGLIHYLTDGLPTLKNITISYCSFTMGNEDVIVGLEDIPDNTQWPLPEVNGDPNRTLESLVLFETSAHAPSKLEILWFLKNYINLRTLEIGAFSSVLHGQEMWNALVNKKTALEKLHFRSIGNLMFQGGGPCSVCAMDEESQGMDKVINEEDNSLKLGMKNLRFSLLRCGSKFFRHSLLVSRYTLESLTLDFVSHSLIESMQQLDYPLLRELTMRFQGSNSHGHVRKVISHSNILKLMPKLRFLLMEALYYKAESLDIPLLSSLSQEGIHLQQLTLIGFVLGRDGLIWFSEKKRFPSLTYLKVTTHSRLLKVPSEKRQFSLTKFEGDDTEDKKEISKVQCLVQMANYIHNIFWSHRSISSAMLALETWHPNNECLNGQLIPGIKKENVVSEEALTYYMLQEFQQLESCTLMFEK